ncbi:MAG: hypothetical protein JXA73_04915 [Acidobacteria bacterium]|nr:hypothetical protein [Acidobacteriota bacterium]
MRLSALDLGIIAVYLISVALFGLFLRRRAARSLNSYLMGDKALPWYFLCVSNASGMFDISGTMWLVTIGSYAKNVNNMLQWIVSGLYGSYVGANVLKWYWWRFNGYGYFWGMVAGLAPALLFPLIWPNTLALLYFPYLLALSLAGCFLGTCFSAPTDMETLKNFYKNVRPWGAWGPVRRLVEAEDPSFQRNRDFKRDAVNVVVGTIWQVSLTIAPFYLVLMKWKYLAAAVALIAVTSFFLKMNWYNKLPSE